MFRVPFTSQRYDLRPEPHGLQGKFPACFIALPGILVPDLDVYEPKMPECIGNFTKTGQVE